MKNRKYFLMNDMNLLSYNELKAIIDIDGEYNEGAVNLSKLLMKKYSYDAILYVDFFPWQNEPSKTDDETLGLFAQWQNKMSYIFKTTYQKYKVLLESYQSQINHLMDKTGAKQTTKFNDTPQAGVGGLDADAYASTYTINESEIGFEAIDRLAKIQSLFANVMQDWCNEFNGLFINI